MDTGRRIDKIFLLHIWACVPFAPLWVLGLPESNATPAAFTMRLIIAAVTVYLVFRTVVVIRGGSLSQWALLWCVIDTLIVTGILIGLRDAEDPTSLIYFLVIAYAGIRLHVREAILVALLAVTGQFTAGLVSHTWDRFFADGNYLYVGFRHFFPLVVVSLIIFLRRESQTLAKRLALNQYQRELSAEMHDGIQHDLVLIARRLDLVEVLAPTEPAKAAAIALEQRETARRASDELRFLVRQTRPDAFANTNFIDALRQHLGILSDRFSQRIDFEYIGPGEPFPVTYQHNVLRFVQEGITNAVKHAGAERITVRIRRGRRQYHIRVADNGRGFPLDGADRNGLGLPGLRERTEALGGRFRIVSRVDTGTAITALLPIDRNIGKAWFHGLHPRSDH